MLHLPVLSKQNLCRWQGCAENIAEGRTAQGQGGWGAPWVKRPLVLLPGFTTFERDPGPIQTLDWGGKVYI